MELNKNYQEIDGATDTVSDIDDLHNTAMTEIETDMTTIETDVTTAEGEIDTLQGKFNASTGHDHD
jgi:hypothetical protein